jgi:transposase
MRFVDVKTTEQQSIMMLHRVRRILTRQRTQLSNALRSHLAEFGIVSPIGREGLDRLLKIVADTGDGRVPAEARASLDMLAAQLEGVKARILENDRRIIANARATEVGRRLLEVPGIGPVLASAFVASVANPAIFKSGRDLAAWIGLVPRQNSSGGKERLGGITKAGNGYLRQMLVVGAMAVIRYAQRDSTRRPWLVQLVSRRPTKVAAIALANKTARTVWALMTSGERYRTPQAIQAAVSATA